jgi:hypothetical protein
MRSLVLGSIGLALGASIDSSPASTLQPDVASQAVEFKGLKHHMLADSKLQRNTYESLEAGHLPLQELFTSEGLAAASKSAGCQADEWKSRMSAVHSLVAQTYILTLPRKNKVEAAMQAAER